MVTNRRRQTESDNPAWILLVSAADLECSGRAYLKALRDRNQLTVEEIERKRQAIIDQGAANGKTISTEAPVISMRCFCPSDAKFTARSTSAMRRTRKE
jgi:hypothetical protein